MAITLIGSVSSLFDPGGQMSEGGWTDLLMLFLLGVALVLVGLILARRTKATRSQDRR